MPYSKIEKPSIDIYTCPKADITYSKQITIGDLHANAMLMMYFLVTNGVFKISDEKYAQLKDIYLKGGDTLDKSDIAKFNHIIDGLEVGEKPLVRFIGDEICDRGENDYFIFKIINKLYQSGVPTEILLSNHGIEFMIPYEQKQELFAPNIGFNGQSRSMDNMRALITKGVITKEEVDTLVSDCYLPHLKLISYSLDGNDMTIYSHAGIGLETIESLANLFKDEGVIYQDDTVKDLANTIEAINTVFDRYVKAGTVHTLTKDIHTRDVQNDPVTFLIWNRDYYNLSREQQHKGYQLFYAHGHDSGEPSANNIFNLDNILGKSLGANTGTYSVVCEVSPFRSQLSKLEAKAKQLLDNGHTDAHNGAMAIHTTFTKAFTQYKKDGDYSAFEKKCTDVIAKERPQLDKHRGWSEFLINLAIAIPTAGIGLLVKGVINLTQNRDFFFVHQTQSSKIVDEIDDQLKQGSGNKT